MGSSSAESSSSLEASPRNASLEENATTELSNVGGFEQHQHLNCYTGHGGEAIGPDDGFQAGVNSVEDCGRVAGHTCFVYFWKQNKCFLRKDCNLAACEEGKQGTESWDFDTFTPGPIGAECLLEHGRGKWIAYSPPGSLYCEAETCDPGYMIEDMACVPTRYNEYDHTNCYSVHGGTALGPNDGLQGARDVEGCKSACNDNLHDCDCFVFFSKYNQCFLRSDCQLSQCEIGVPGQESYDFATYKFTFGSSQSSSAESSSSLEASPRNASLEENATTELSNVVGFEQHQHLNCYT